MKTVTKTALANVRQNKGRNILCGIAIGLTTLLIFVILTLGFGMLGVRDAAVNAYYPTFHTMLRGVSEDELQQLKAYDDIETMGLRADFGEIVHSEETILMITMDTQAEKLNKIKLEAGNFPKEKNEVVVSKNMLKKLGLQAELGDEITLPYQLYEENGLGYEKDDVFRICGFSESTEVEGQQSIYVAFFSKQYMEEQVPKNDCDYRVMLRIANSQKMTTDDIEKRCNEIGAAVGCAEPDIVLNTSYLAANYKDPSTYPIIAVIIAVVVIAGILTIYSIYYVSMTPKIQEYGKLKAMGATKKQIRQIVFREGMLVTLLAVPAGLIISSVISRLLMIGMFRFMNSQEEYAKLALKLLENGDVAILLPWIYLLTIVVTFATVLLSILRPMQKAAAISPVEAMRYQENSVQSKKKVRKGYQELNLFRLTRANLQRNKKRTMITIITLSATGILFIVISHVLSCSNPKVSAKRAIEGDYRIEIDSSERDKMNPQKAWNKIQQNNPMDEAFLEEVQSVKGVKSVKTKSFLMGDIEGITTAEGEFRAHITGVDESYKNVLEKGVKEGHLDWEELIKGNQIILDDGFLTYYFPELKVGDTLHFTLECGEQKVEKTFEIAAIGDYADGFVISDFILPKSVMESMTAENLNHVCEIEVDEKQKQEAYAALQSLADHTGTMETDTYEKNLALYKKQSALLSMMSYTFLMVLGGIGIMNLLNTMVNSIYTRKHELGVMQAIGLSKRQLTRMLQLEGLFYTAGVLILSLGVGSIAGYGVFLYAKAEHLFDVQVYQYPVIPAMILVLAVTVIQLLLSYGIMKNFRKQSLIEQIRYSE